MPASLDPATHRQLGVDLYNHTWALLGRDARTPEDDDAMIHAAYASLYHWGQFTEDPKHHARGEWLISRVFSELGRAEPALYHARRCLRWCETGPVEDWDTPVAHEALARAYATAGDWAASERHERLARELGASVADEEDRKQLESELGTLPRRAR